MIDIYNLPSDEKTWKLLATGKTAGIFQLDNESLGGRFCKKVAPKSIEDLAAVITIIRPGVLAGCLDDGESAAIHFERRHRGIEKDQTLHPALENILKDTHQIILYQEQIMRIVQELANFDGPQSMRLLKGIGKKKADVLFALEEDFVSGCKENNIEEEDSKKIFDIIKESARYSFNKSHAVGYAKRAYVDAYIKANNMTEFYVAALRLVKDKINHKEKTKQLIKEAETFGLQVYPPRLHYCYPEFTGKNKKIWCGISNIKGIGLAQAELICEVAKQEPTDWYNCLMMLLPIKKSTVENTIKVGLYKSFDVPVKQQLDEYSSLLLLSKKEKQLINENYKRFTNVIDLLKWLKPNAMKRRVDKIDSIIKMLENPAETLKDKDIDTPKYEEALLNCAVSYDNIDTVTAFGNCTIEEFNNKKFLKEYKMVCEVARFKPHEIGKGDNKGKIMCFLDLVDSTGKMSSCLFDEAYEDFGNMVQEGAVLHLTGYRGKKGTLVIQEMKQLA
jgi:DNA polymerase III alpha subunit